MKEFTEDEFREAKKRYRKSIKLLLSELKLIFDSWGRVAARKLLILLVWGTDFSKM